MDKQELERAIEILDEAIDNANYLKDTEVNRDSNKWFYEQDVENLNWLKSTLITKVGGLDESSCTRI